jgi:peptidoglycan glycosyltransferase
VGINPAIARLGAVFTLLLCIVAARTFWVQVVAGPALAADPRDPRTQLLGRYRGEIVARDGTVLAAAGERGPTYPFGAAYAHVVGYDSARYGTSGLEAAFDRELAPAPVVADPWAQLQALWSHHPLPAAIRGATIVATLDPPTQAALVAGLAPYPRGAGVALDPRTGEILAMASVPSFDPGTIDVSFPALSKRSDSPLLDRAIDGLYPPGSTFKIFTAAAALDSGVLTPDDTFLDNGSLPVGNFVIHDNEGEATGRQNAAGAFALSSNVDFATIALRLGVDRWFAYAARWQLGQPLDFTLPAQTDHLPTKESVSPSILAQLGFGEADLLVTPLRMALMGATIAAGGVEPQPYLVRSVRSGDGSVREPPARAALATPISADVAGEVRDFMVAAVARGTGTAAALPGVTVAGKTGTATNPAGRAHAWFVAFAPAQAPRVAVAVVVENAGYGGDIAAPIARRMLAAALRRP